MKCKDKEYYDYICSLCASPKYELTEQECKKLNKIIRKIENKLRDTASKGKTYLIVDYIISGFLDSLIDNHSAVFVNLKWRKALNDTLYKRLKNGGFEIHTNNFYFDMIIWKAKE